MQLSFPRTIFGFLLIHSLNAQVSILFQLREQKYDTIYGNVESQDSLFGVFFGIVIVIGGFFWIKSICYKITILTLFKDIDNKCLEFKENNEKVNEVEFTKNQQMKQNWNNENFRNSNKISEEFQFKEIHPQIQQSDQTLEEQPINLNQNTLFTNDDSSINFQIEIEKQIEKKQQIIQSKDSYQLTFNIEHYMTGLLLMCIGFYFIFGSFGQIKNLIPNYSKQQNTNQLQLFVFSLVISFIFSLTAKYIAKKKILNHLTNKIVTINN